MYSEDILSVLREMQDLEPDDSSHDSELNVLSPSEAFEMVLNFHGIYGYDIIIKEAIEDIYGFDIDEMFEYKNH